MTTIKDSGTRRKFETGAVRDMQEGKGRMDLLPWCAVLRVARHFEAGAVKYGDRNWERGIPLSSFMDSAFRHLAKYMDGLDDEDHLCAAAWNLLCALWTEEKRPDLINIPTRPEYAGGAQYGLENEDKMITETETNDAMREAENDQKLKEHYWRTSYKELLADVIVRALPDPDGFSRILVHDGDGCILVTKANGWPLGADDQDQVLKVVAEFERYADHPELVPRVEFSSIKTD